MRNTWTTAVLAGALGLTVAACSTPSAAPPAGAMPTALPAGPDDPLLMQRRATVPKTRPWPIEWFQPVEVVQGADRHRPIPLAGPTTISPQALAAARDYAMARGTQAFLVWRKGRLEEATYAPGFGPATHTNTYYMHLPVLTLLYGAALRDGHIGSVDDPVSRYLPEWANDERGRITLRQMFHMAAGLEMYFDSNDPANKATQLFFGSDSTAPALRYSLAEPPGRTFAYNYLIPELLGIVLERAVKERYSSYLSRRLWRPIGARDAHLWLDRPGGRPHYNSSLFASAEDWLRIGMLIAQEGRAGGRQVIPAGWVRTMKTPSPVNPNYGMLWIGSPYVAERSYARDVNYKVKASAPYAASDLVYLDGYGGQRVYVSPSEQLVIVRIGLAQRNDWDDAALPNLILAGMN